MYEKPISEWEDCVLEPRFDFSVIRPKPPETCSHKWKKIPLLYSTVYNCEICGISKEKYERIINEQQDIM